MRERLASALTWIKRNAKTRLEFGQLFPDAFWRPKIYGIMPAVAIDAMHRTPPLPLTAQLPPKTSHRLRLRLSLKFLSLMILMALTATSRTCTTAPRLGLANYSEGLWGIGLAERQGGDRQLC